jgi:hypothetical protein
MTHGELSRPLIPASQDSIFPILKKRSDLGLGILETT